MRHVPLTGYLLYARAYQEKRAIYQFFSHEWGVVHGVGMRGMPMFNVIELFANGQNALKNFSQIHIKDTQNPTLGSLGQSYYALLYLNEMIAKLIALENPCPMLWQSYHNSVQALQNTHNVQEIKRVLRAFEVVLFDELGVSIDWQVDSLGAAINPKLRYEFVPNQGFVITPHGSFTGNTITMLANHGDVYDMADSSLNDRGRIFRILIDFLLDYRPLNSRKLWTEQLKYR